MLGYGPVRPAAEGHQRASESRCRRLSTGRPGGRDAQCPCMGFRLHPPALALQPSDTTCSRRRQQPPTCSALLSPEARLHRTPRGPRRIPPPPSPTIPTPLHAPPAAHRGPLPADVPRLLPAGAAIWAAPTPPATLAAPGPPPGVGLPAGPRGGPGPPHRESPAPSGGGAGGAPGATGPCPQRGRRGNAGTAGSTGAGGGAPGGPSSPGAYRGATPATRDNRPPVSLPPTGPTR